MKIMSFTNNFMVFRTTMITMRAKRARRGYNQ